MSLGKGQVSYDFRDDSLFIRLSGEIDHHSAVNVRTGMDDLLLSERPKKVFLDLSGVNFMDSSGLGLIMGRYALIQRYGGKLAVENPSAAVQKMLDLAGMERLIPVRHAKVASAGKKRKEG